MRMLIRSISLVFLLAGTTAHAANPDSWITTKIKLALWTTAGIPSTEVDVDTVDGKVTLHGKVETQAEKASAETEAEKIDGVKRVRNLLQVVPERREKALQKDDKQIKNAAEAALKATHGIDDVKIVSVNAGVVLLGGKAETLDDQVRAIRAVYGVSGVRRVASEIQGSDRVFTERDADALDPKTARSPKDHDARPADAWITMEVKMSLLADSKVPATDINVDTRNGVVTLFGTVPTDAARRAAEVESKKIAGVEQVTNDIQVVPSAKKEIVKATDAAIEKNLKQALAARRDLDKVDVSVKGGKVRLTGSVPSRMQKLEALLVSRTTDGVKGVSSDLTIKKAD